MTTLQIADVVSYGFRGEKPTTWRVTSFLKRIDDKLETATKPPDDADFLERMRYDIAMEWALKDKLRREERGLPCSRRFRFQWCKREEATHVELVGVSGCIAPVQNCEFVKVVAWDAEDVERERKSYETFPLIGELTDWLWE